MFGELEGAAYIRELGAPVEAVTYIGSVVEEASWNPWITMTGTGMGSVSLPTPMSSSPPPMATMSLKVFTKDVRPTRTGVGGALGHLVEVIREVGATNQSPVESFAGNDRRLLSRIMSETNRIAMECRVGPGNVVLLPPELYEAVSHFPIGNIKMVSVPDLDEVVVYRAADGPNQTGVHLLWYGSVREDKARRLLGLPETGVRYEALVLANDPSKFVRRFRFALEGEPAPTT